MSPGKWQFAPNSNVTPSPIFSGKPQVHCVGDIERRQDQSVFKVAKREQMFSLAGQKMLRVSSEI